VTRSRPQKNRTDRKGKKAPDKVSSPVTKSWLASITAPGTLNLVLGGVVLVMLVLLLSRDSESEPTVLIATETITTTDKPVASPAIVPLAQAEPLAPAEPEATTEPLAEIVSSTDNSSELPALADFQDDPAASLPTTAKLVLILDDIGYSAEAGLRAIDLPALITFAVIPHTPHGKALAEAAHLAGRELMLHAPMSNLSGMELGEGGLTLQQSEEEFLQVLTASLADIPYIKGVNNHTGSELTAAVQPMQWVMQELKKRDLYFVDSMTTRDSVAGATAAQFRVPSLRRHVFLDNIQTAEAIHIEFKRAVALAQEQGYAVAIGHPYPETLAYLESALPLLAASQVEIVPVSVLLAQLEAAGQTPSHISTHSNTDSAATAAW
jgi:polysaccharide deacetylase 2 family uncharacterized protein YibQ